MISKAKILEEAVRQGAKLSMPQLLFPQSLEFKGVVVKSGKFILCVLSHPFDPLSVAVGKCLQKLIK